MGGQEGEDGVGGVVEGGEGLGIVGELVGVDEAAVGLVEGVGGDAVVFVELFADGGAEGCDETVDLGLGGLVAGDGVGAGEAGEPLAEGVAGDVAGHVFGRVEERRWGVPAAEVFSGGGLAGELTEGLEHAVFVEIEEEGVVLLELDQHRAVEELDVFVVELGQRGGGCCRGGRRGEGVGVAEDGGACGEGCAGLEEGSAGWFGHGWILLGVGWALLRRVEKSFSRNGAFHAFPLAD